MGSWAESIGISGIIVLNLIFLRIRFFARSQGLQVRWWSRSYAAERAHLRMLARGADVGLARRARLYLRLEILAWVLFVPLAGMLFWGAAKQGGGQERLAAAGPETWRVGPHEYHLASTHYERGTGNEVRYVMTYPVSSPTGTTSVAPEDAAAQALPLIRYAYEHRTFERAHISPVRGTESSPPNLAVDLTSVSDGHAVFRYEVPAGEVSWRLAHPAER
jgi:hypothetical protein